MARPDVPPVFDWPSAFFVPHWLSSASVLPATSRKAPAHWRRGYAIEAAVAGQGVYLVSSDVVANDVASGRLHRVSDIGFHDGGFYLIQAQGSARRKAIRVFSDWMLKQAAPWRGGSG